MAIDDRDKHELVECFLTALDVWKKELYTELATACSTTIDIMLNELMDVLDAKGREAVARMREANKDTSKRVAGFTRG